MHNAPSVSFPVGRSRFYGALLAAAWALAALTGAVWWMQARTDALHLAAWFGVWALAGALAWRNWQRAPAGMLRWQDRQWRFMPAAAAHAGQPLAGVQVVLDLQHVLLLRVEAADPDVKPASPGSAWLWLARRDDPPHWYALRRAVHDRTVQWRAGDPHPAATGEKAVAP